MSDTLPANSYDPHRGWARHDVSDVAPQGAYVAKRCPVRAQWDVLQPGEPVPLDEVVIARMSAGDDHEDAVVAAILDHHPTAVVVDEDDRVQREVVTGDAMRDGAGLIVAGRLPLDEAGRRVGEPDVLVRVGDGPVDGRWRYLAVDIKGHYAQGRGRNGTAAVVVGLDGLAAAPDPASEDEGAGRRHRDDLLQLAHYHRMLEACGHAPPEGAWGGIIGTEATVVWYDLERERWRTPSVSEGTKRRGTLDIYDFEFAFRLDIKAVAARHLEDPSVPLLVEPVVIGECSSCPWWGVCEPLLAEREDISLLPRLGWREWSAFRDVGVTTLPQLAACDPDEVEVDLPAAVVTGFVQTARALTGDASAYRLPGVDRVEVPRADLEVDIDMESINAGVYLWGVWVTDRADLGIVVPGYHHFGCFDDTLTDGGDVAAFAAFWSWFNEVRAACGARGASVAAYCWYAGAEEAAMRTVAPGAGLEDEVEEFVASAEWVDLYAVTKEQLVTGRGFGLKQVAPLAGFEWRDDEPGGERSMLWFDEAIDPDTRADRREELVARLLAYNEDDVLATVAVREWLDRGDFPALP